MKWLPEKYMESQEDFFAKRGLSWHISVVVKKVTSTTTKSTQPKNATGNDESENEETSDEEAEEEEMSAQNSYTHTVYVHAMDHCVQDNESVVAILQDVLTRVKADDPSIEYAY
ncbi:unnamed protein product, partial [Didymodactylos carnosus]